MLSRRRRFGQPSYAPLATDAQMLLLVLLAARMPRRLPNFLLSLCVARRRPLQVHEHLSRTRAAHTASCSAVVKLS